MGLEKVAANSAFKQSKEFTGGADKKVFKALSKAKVNKKRLAIEVLWIFGGALIAFFVAFIVFYLIGQFMTDVFVEFVQKLDSLTKFYFWIFIFCFIGVYIARLIVWAMKTVLIKE